MNIYEQMRFQPSGWVSYWQVGCDDAKARRGLNENLRWANGYENGYRWGKEQMRKVMAMIAKAPDTVLSLTRLEVPDPPLKNPYMEGLEAVEGILQRLQTFTKEYPAELDTEQAMQYTEHLLEIRDKFSDLRQKEMLLG